MTEERRVVIAALLAALAAAALDLVVLRSFEFVKVAQFLPTYAPPRPAPGPGPAPPPPGAVPVTRTVDGVTIVIVDGLRVDTSNEMPAWNALRLRGTDAIVRVDFPSFSRVGYAGLLTGAEPRVHGYLSNHNIRPSPVESIVDLARAAGFRTRMYHEHHTWIPAMFPRAFEEVRPLAELVEASAPSARPSPASPGVRPHLTVVYISEPDLTAHEHGATGEAYRRKALEVDATCARVARQVDLRREALFFTTDHGHIRQGGHGGHEPDVMLVPLVAAGPDVDVTEFTRLRQVAPAAARLLGLPPPAGALVRAPADALPARAVRVLIALAILSVVAGIGRGPLPLDVVAGAAALGAFALLYHACGFPFSFSCVNSSADVPRFVAQVLGLAAVAVLAAAGLARAGTRYIKATLLMGALAVAATGAVAGPTAATAIDHPQAAYLYHLALSFVVSTGLVSPLALRIGRPRPPALAPARGRPAPRPAAPRVVPPAPPPAP